MDDNEHFSYETHEQHIARLTDMIDREFQLGRYDPDIAVNDSEGTLVAEDLEYEVPEPRDTQGLSRSGTLTSNNSSTLAVYDGSPERPRSDNDPDHTMDDTEADAAGGTSGGQSEATEDASGGQSDVRDDARSTRSRLPGRRALAAVREGFQRTRHIFRRQT